MKRKWVIAGGDIPEHFAASWGGTYKPGEILKGKTLERVLDMSLDELLPIYKDLCKPHRQFIARRFADGYMNGDLRVTKEKVTALNKATTDGFLRSVFKEMAEKEAASL